MLQTARALKPASLPHHHVELLVAVGMDGRAVVVSIIEGNPDLLHDVTTMEAAMALWPSPIPSRPGLYLFSGTSQLESLGDSGNLSLSEVFHRCTYRPISNADLAMLRTQKSLII